MKSLLIILGIIAIYAIIHYLIPGLMKFSFIRTAMVSFVGAICLGIGILFLLFKR